MEQANSPINLPLTNQSETLGNKIFTHSPKFIFLVLFSLGLIVFSSLITYSIVWSRFNKNNFQPILTPALSLHTSPLPTITQTVSNQMDTLLFKKKYKDIEIGAFSIYEKELGKSIGGGENQISEIYIVSPIVNGKHLTYFDSFSVATAYGWFSKDRLFDMVGDDVYVVDERRNVIDEYSLIYQSGEGRMEYKKSIELPKYKIGTLYAIQCESAICNLRTAFHQEAGCGLSLNVTTLTYSTPECSGMGGKIAPEKIQ